MKKEAMNLKESNGGRGGKWEALDGGSGVENPVIIISKK